MDSETPTPPPKPPTKRDTFVERVSHGLAAVAGTLLLALFFVNVAQLIARPIMGGWIWVNDLSRLLIAWVIMLGASAAVGLREHLIVDFIVDRAPKTFRTVCAYLVRVAEVGVGFILLVSGAVVAMERMNIQYIQLGIPTGFAYLAVPVLGFFMVAFGLLMSPRPPVAPTDVVIEEGAAR